MFLKTTDFVGLAKSLGIDGEKVTNPDPHRRSS